MYHEYGNRRVHYATQKPFARIEVQPVDDNPDSPDWKGSASACQQELRARLGEGDYQKWAGEVLPDVYVDAATWQDIWQRSWEALKAVRAGGDLAHVIEVSASVAVVHEISVAGKQSSGERGA